MNNLSKQMQERLDQWRENVLPVKSASILKKKSPGNFVPRRMEYGEDTRDFFKDKEAWAYELQNNTIYKGFQ